MTTVISFIVVLGVLIFIHELGHFAIAKWKGVGVEKFSLGFGPKLVGVKKGETEYLVSLLPLGGYVKMTGEAPGDEVPEEEANKSFAKKPVTTRAAIVAAGPVMNLILAAVLFPVIFMIGIQIPSYLERPVEVGYVSEGGIGDKAGMKKGDVITSVNGKPVKTWEEFLEIIDFAKELNLDIARKGGDISLSLTPSVSRETGEGSAGIFPVIEPVIGKVSDGYPAKEAGFKPGDRILSIDGREITHWAELEQIIRKSNAKMRFLVARDDGTVGIDVTPARNKEIPDKTVYMIGIARKMDTVTRRYGPLKAVPKGFEAAFDMGARLFLVIKGLVLGKYSLKTLGGPLMIAQYAGEAAKAGVADLLTLIAFLSLQLGIINLFPIPVLDGGHIFFFCIEVVKGKPLSERFMTIAQQVGVALLVALMLLVTYNDIFRIIGGRLH